MKSAAQKFYRGDRVRIINDVFGRRYLVDSSVWEDLHRGDVGEEIVIKGSYRDLYNDATATAPTSYSAYYCTDGMEIAWFDECKLEFVQHDGEEGIRRLKDRWEARIRPTGEA